MSDADSTIIADTPAPSAPPARKYVVHVEEKTIPVIADKVDSVEFGQSVFKLNGRIVAIFDGIYGYQEVTEQEDSSLKPVSE